MNTDINFDVVTIEDCFDMMEKKNMYVVLDNGKVITFVKDESEE